MFQANAASDRCCGRRGRALHRPDRRQASTPDHPSSSMSVPPPAPSGTVA